MAISQLPAEFPISLVPGDEVNFALRFNLDLTGYTLAAFVYDASQASPAILEFPAVTFEVEGPEEGGEGEGGEGEGGEEEGGEGEGGEGEGGEEPVTTLVTVSFDESDTALLSTAQARRWRWFLRWVSPGGVTRTVLAGPITSRGP